MTINFILYNLPSRSETFLNNLIIRSINCYSRVNLVVLESNKDESYYKLNKRGIFIYNYSYLKFWYIFKNFYFLIEHYAKFRNLRHAIIDTIKFGFFEKSKPQVIHVLYSGIASDSYFLIEKLKLNNKIIISCRGSAENVKALINIERRCHLVNALNHATHVHCVSERMKNKLINFGVSEKLCFLNRPAIDLNKFKSAKVRKSKEKNEVFDVVTTGRLNYIKGYIFVILAIRKIIIDGFNIRYTIIGDGPDMEFLQFAINDLNLENYIILKGGLSQDDVLIELGNADLFLLPSLSEGISNAVLEAMAMSLPIISTNVGGMNEVIENNKTGLLIDSFSADAIYESLIFSILNYDKMIQYAVNGKDYVLKNHNLEVQFEKFREKYEN